MQDPFYLYIFGKPHRSHILCKIPYNNLICLMVFALDLKLLKLLLYQIIEYQLMFRNFVQILCETTLNMRETLKILLPC